jgi:hypothetical protein
MRRVIYAMISAAIISMVTCATSNAARITPIPTITVPNAGNLIQAGYYYHGRYYPYRRHRGYYARAHNPYYGAGGARTYGVHGLSLPMLENIPP